MWRGLRSVVTEQESWTKAHTYRNWANWQNKGVNSYKKDKHTQRIQLQLSVERFRLRPMVAVNLAENAEVEHITQNVEKRRIFVENGPCCYIDLDDAIWKIIGKGIAGWRETRRESDRIVEVMKSYEI